MPKNQNVPKILPLPMGVGGVGGQPNFGNARIWENLVLQPLPALVGNDRVYMGLGCLVSY